MKILILLLSILLLPTAVYADTLKGGYEVCLSEDLFDQFGSAVAKKDERALEYLLENGCFVSKPGIEISVLNVGWTGTVKVRAYIGDDAVVLWTSSGNIQRK